MRMVVWAVTGSAPRRDAPVSEAAGARCCEKHVGFNDKGLSDGLLDGVQVGRCGEGGRPIRPNHDAILAENTNENRHDAFPWNTLFALMSGNSL
jgi:hypothetical protein